jgi:hypothetical protein
VPSADVKPMSNDLVLELCIYYNSRTKVLSIKSSLLMKMIEKTQTIQLFTMNIKTESIYKSYQKSQAMGLG